MYSIQMHWIPLGYLMTFDNSDFYLVLFTAMAGIKPINSSPHTHASYIHLHRKVRCCQTASTDHDDNSVPISGGETGLLEICEL